MVKFIILEKRKLFKLIFFIVSLFILLIIFFSIIFKNNSIQSFMSSTIHNQNDADYDGDGTIDNIIIEKKNSHYIVKVKTSKSYYVLKNALYGDALIDLSASVSLKIDSLDLSRDGIPEIILSGYKNQHPITYIYQWCDSEFKEVFSSSKNVFGIIDSKNSRTPKILHTFSEKGDKSTESIIFNGKIIKDITFSKLQIPALAIIQKFIDLIQLSYEIEDPPEIFTEYINSEELKILWNLDKETYRYSFQLGNFYDINWDKNALPSSIIWNLSFEKVNSSDSTKPNEEIIFTVKTDINQFGEYKISSIKKQN